jgi:nucleoside-diphosphate-sugar epimerase
MRQVLVTGSSGFVGKNVFNFLKVNYKLREINRLDILKLMPRDLINSKAVIHLAGKAHDLRGISNSDEYYRVNTDLAKTVFDAFLDSEAKVFITLSSVKAVADEVEGHLTEEFIPVPITHYGKSKLLAEQYILSKEIPHNKRVYILRPCMIHGQGNKGNLNSLYNLVSKGIPWPLGAFENKRSFCSIDNLMFIIKELIEREDIPSGVYHVADDESLSTNDVISILAETQNKKPKIWNVPKSLIKSLAKLGDFLHLPLTTERLQKLTESYLVSNQKIKTAIGKDLPVSAKDGLLKTFKSFNKSVQ